MVFLGVVAVQLIGLLVNAIEASAVLHEELSGNTVTEWLVLETLESGQSLSVQLRLARFEEFLCIEFGVNVNWLALA